MKSAPKPRPELLLSATLLLLVKGASSNACPGQVLAIRQHLEMLAAHPEMHAMVRDTCLKLAQGLSAQADQPQGSARLH